MQRTTRVVARSSSLKRAVRAHTHTNEHTTAMMLPSWEGAEAYVKRHCATEVPWIPLLRDGQVTRKLVKLVADGKGDLAFAHEEFTYRLSDAGLTPIKLAQGFTDEQRTAYRSALMDHFKMTGALGVPAKKAKEMAIAAPGTSVCYDSSNGYLSSLLLKLSRYDEFCRTGADPLVDRAEKRRVKKEPAPAPALAPAPDVKPPKKKAKQTPAPAPVAVAVATPVATPVVTAAPMPASVPAIAPKWGTPTPVQQHLRSAATCSPLTEYLKKKNKFKHAGNPHWNAIKKWCETDEGLEWIRASGLDVQAFHLHHIKAKARGGVSSIFNCAFVPGGANSKWGDKDSEEMRAAVGKQACKIADTFATWFVSKMGDGPDQSGFDWTAAAIAR